MKNKKEIIITENVTKSFGNFEALRGITSTVHESEVVVVFGPSGSGKSTFIRTLNRLETHDSGKIINLASLVILMEKSFESKSNMFCQSAAINLG